MRVVSRIKLYCELIQIFFSAITEHLPEKCGGTAVHTPLYLQNFICEDGRANLSGRFDLLAEQDGAAAHKDRLAGMQVNHSFTQLAEQIVNEKLRLVFYKANDSFNVFIRLVLHYSVYIRFVHRQVIISVYLVFDSVIEGDNAVFKGITDGEISLPIFSK